MSKAFTKEDDDAPVPPVTRLGIPVPDPNPVTAAGLARLRADPEAAKDVADHLVTAVVVAPPEDRSRVAFGAVVTVEDSDGGARHVYRIVGAVESDPKAGAVSWQSPIARALIGARVGDSVALPRGEVDVVTIDY